jgi:hypothetical protein
MAELDSEVVMTVLDADILEVIEDADALLARLVADGELLTGGVPRTRAPARAPRSNRKGRRR